MHRRVDVSSNCDHQPACGCDLGNMRYELMAELRPLLERIAVAAEALVPSAKAEKGMASLTDESIAFFRQWMNSVVVKTAPLEPRWVCVSCGQDDKADHSGCRGYPQPTFRSVP